MSCVFRSTIFKRIFIRKIVNVSNITIKNARSIFTTLLNETDFNPDSSTRVPSILEVKDKLATLMGVKSGYMPIQESRQHLMQYLPLSQAELEPRTMQDSFSSALIPLSTDSILQDRYITFLGSVRLGRLLEDMDIFAVWVTHKHIKNPKQKPGIPTPHTLVTVLVDKIDFTDFKPTPADDIRLSGHASWVGKSSVEVVVWLEQNRHGEWHRLTRAVFLMAARCPMNKMPAVVNSLKPGNAAEQKILDGGETRKKRRITLQQNSLLKVVPSDEEQKIIHNLFIRTMTTTEISLLHTNLPPGCVWMQSASLSNVIYSHPQHRNLHNTVFGGFLMRQAVELSWALAYLFSKYRPELRQISDINFHKAIDVNSLIRMHAYVVYTQMQYIQITVYAESFAARTGTHNTTNVLHFTFALPEQAPEVIPQTYHEAMMYLDGRRHFLDAVNEKAPNGSHYAA